jgi:hypothetical protein
MDLKDFVSKTLCQIVEGVQAAQSQIEVKGAVINPALMGDFAQVAKHGGGLMTSAGGYAQVVEFDVALTVRKVPAQKAVEKVLIEAKL